MNNLALEGKRVIVAAERVHTQVCPKCQRAYPNDYQGRYCPDCGTVRPEAVTLSADAQMANPMVSWIKRKKIWWIVFAVLLILLLSELIIVVLVKSGPR